MTVGSDPLGGGGTPFVQVVGGIRGLISELEKYFLCEPFRGSVSKVSYVQGMIPYLLGPIAINFLP